MTKLKHIANQAKFCFGGTRPVTGPLKVFWEITHRCNSRCINCDMWQKKATPEMSAAHALNLVEQISDIGALHLSISGGETFLRNDIFDILESAKKKGLKISVNSNALLLNREKIKHLCELQVESTYISLDGATDESNQAIRGVKEGFRRALDAVAFFKDCSKNGKSKVFINTTINHLNAFELRQIADIVSNSEADGWTMSVVQNVDIYKPKPEVLLTPDDIKEIEKAIHDIRKKYPRILPHMSEYFNNFRNSVLYPAKLYQYRCVAGYLTMMIHPNGDVFSCPVAFEKTGNVLEKSLKEIWFNEMQDLRERIKKGKHPVCWFDCISPINILMSCFAPSKWHKLLEPSFLKHLFHKAF